MTKTFITTDDRFFIDESKIEISHFTKEKIINKIYDEQTIIDKIEEAKAKVKKQSKWWWNFTKKREQTQLKLLDFYLSNVKEKYFRPEIVQKLYVEFDIIDIPIATVEERWIIKLGIKALDDYYFNSGMNMNNTFCFNTEDEAYDFIYDNLSCNIKEIK